MLATGLAVLHVVALKHPGPLWEHAQRFAVIVAGLLVLRLSVLRFHDRDRHGAWSLALLVPGLNVVALFVLALVPGVDRPTRHGDAAAEGSVGELSFGAAVLLLFAGLGVLSFHPSHAVDALKSAEALRAVAPFGSAQAKAAYEEHYVIGPRPKAYAATSQGTYAWSVAASSTDEAVVQALRACEAQRRWVESKCLLIDVNDLSVFERAATR